MNITEIMNASFDDLVFEGKNKSYGAYVLRKKFNKNMLMAAIITSGVFTAIILAFFLPNILKGDEEEVIEEQMKVTYADLGEVPDMEEDEQEIEAPPPSNLPSTPPPPPPTIKFVPPVVKKDEDVKKEEIMKDMDELIEKADENQIGKEDAEGDKNSLNLSGIFEKGGTGTNVTKPPKKKKKKELGLYEFVKVEKQPVPVNLNDIKKNIGYPANAKAAGIEGKVVIRVLVGSDGRYKKHVVIKKPHALLVAPCVKEVKKLQFTPAIQAGKPVQCWVNIPFKFKLNK